MLRSQGRRWAPGSSSFPLAAALAANPIRSSTRFQTLSLPAQPHSTLLQQAVNGRMDNRHRLSPTWSGRYRARDFTWAHCRAGRSGRQQGQHHIARIPHHGWRLRPDDRPDVIGSGLGDGRQSAGGVTRCWLVPKPIAPGCWRVSPEKSAAAASASVAPPRIIRIISRYRCASSKFSARAAPSIFARRVSMVSVILSQRTTMRSGGRPAGTRKSQPYFRRRLKR
jgi:hypothetical protein